MSVAEEPQPDSIGELAEVRFDGDVWTLEVVPSIANWGGAIFGGAALGASVDLIAEVSGCAVRWASTRFLRAPSIGETLVMDVRVDAAGKRTRHMTVTARSEEGVAFETMAVAGDGDQSANAISGEWRPMPDVPPPDAIAPLQLLADQKGRAMGHFDRRPVPLEPTDPPSARFMTWNRITDGSASSPAALAWLADMVAPSVRQVVGEISRGTSLDNTIRYATAAESEWVLVDIVGQAAADGYAFGDVYLYGEDGRLLGVGSQTCMVRRAV